MRRCKLWLACQNNIWNSKGQRLWSNWCSYLSIFSWAYPFWVIKFNPCSWPILVTVIPLFWLKQIHSKILTCNFGCRVIQILLQLISYSQNANCFYLLPDKYWALLFWLLRTFSGFCELFFWIESNGALFETE